MCAGMYYPLFEDQEHYDEEVAKGFDTTLEYYLQSELGDE